MRHVVLLLALVLLFVGSIKKHKYHYPSCYWAGQINSENLITFKDKSAAHRAGYVACKVCRP
jgi:methylphosphotriester-DNA--protein-cysteine methyltransferase